MTAQWEPTDTEEPMALMVKGSRMVLDDQFPEGKDWAFLRDPDALQEYCMDAAGSKSEGPPTTPTKAGDGSFTFGSPAGQSPPARDPHRGKQLRPPPPARLDEESESSDSDDGEDDSDSGDSGPPPAQQPAQQLAATDAGRTNIAHTLKRHGLTLKECRDPKSLKKRRAFLRPHAIDALCELAVGGHVARAPDGGAGPGASTPPADNAAVVLGEVLVKQQNKFCKTLVNMQNNNNTHQERTNKRSMEGFIRMAAVCSNKRVEGENSNAALLW
jgi:hypothetical protein